MFQPGSDGQFVGEIMSNVQQSPWISFEGTTGVISPGGGVLAGTAWADMVFTLLVTRALSHCRLRLEAMGITFQIDAQKICQVLKSMGMKGDVSCAYLRHRSKMFSRESQVNPEESLISTLARWPIELPQLSKLRRRSCQ